MQKRRPLRFAHVSCKGGVCWSSAPARMAQVRHTAECFHATPTSGGDSRIAEPAKGSVPLPDGSCRRCQGDFARSGLSGLFVEARPKQCVLCLLKPVPVIPSCSFTHSALLEMKRGWRSAKTANRACSCGVVLPRKKVQDECRHASLVRDSPVTVWWMKGQEGVSR
jgi:hypothetical protein